MTQHRPPVLRPPAEEPQLAMRFAAVSDKAGANLAWHQLHDALITTFPTQRRGPVGGRLYAREAGLEVLADIAAVDGTRPDEYATLRAKVAELGFLVVVHVDVVLDES